MGQLREPTAENELWEGHKLTQEEARNISGIERVHWLEDFPRLFHGLMCECDHVYLNSNEHKRAVTQVESRDARFIRDCQARYPLHDYRRLARLMHALRSVKSDAEIQLLRHACAITQRGFRRVLRFVRPGVNESEVEAELAERITADYVRILKQLSVDGIDEMPRATQYVPDIIATKSGSSVLRVWCLTT